MDRYNIYSLPKSFDGTYLCPSCRRNFYSEKTGRHYCPGCGLRITVEQPAQAEEEIQALAAGTDWDKKVDGAKINAFISTTLAGIFRPRSFFAEVARGEKMMTAFTYAYFMQVLASFSSFLLVLLLAPLLQQETPLASASDLVAGWATYLELPALMVWIAIVLLGMLCILGGFLFTVALGEFILAAMAHFGLLLVGGAKQPYSATYRALCYSSAIMPLMILPLVNFFAGLYYIFIYHIALSRAHGISWFRVLLSWLLPTALFFGLIFILSAV